MSARKTGLQLALLGSDAVVFLTSGIVLYGVISRVAGSALLGQYTLVLSWMLVFQSIGSFGVPELLMRELGRFPQDRSEHLGAGLVLGIIASVVVMPIMVAVSRVAGYDGTMEHALAIAALSLPGAMILNVARSGLIVGQRIEFVFATRLFEFLVVLPLNVVLLFRGHGIEALTTVLVVGRAASSMLALYLLHRHALRVTWRPSRASLHTLLSPAVTFATSNSLGMAGMHLNVIMLSLMTPVATVGHYGAAYKLIESMTLATVLFGQFYMPRIAHSLAAEPARGLQPFAMPFGLLFAVTMPAGIGLMLFPDIIVSLLFGPNFVETVWVLRVMGVFYLVCCFDALLSLVLKAASLQRLDLAILPTNPLANMLVNLALIPHAGAVGAAIGQLTGGLCTAGLRYTFATRRIGQLRWMALAAPWAIAGLCVGGAIVVWGGSIPAWSRLLLYGVLVMAMVSLAAHSILTGSERTLQPGVHGVPTTRKRLRQSAIRWVMNRDE